MKPLAALSFLMLLLTACANPINRATSDNYNQTCLIAESNDQLDVAEEACARALVNAEWGNLGPERKSQSLYNLGRIKRKLAKFNESERLFKESLAIEEKLSERSDHRIGRRLVELSVSLASQNKISEGVEYLERVLPIANQFSVPERVYTAEVLKEYAKSLRGMSKIELAERFEARAQALR